MGLNQSRAEPSSLCAVQVLSKMPTQSMDFQSEHKHEHDKDHDHGYGSIRNFIRRVHSFEDLLKKLRWERSAAHPQPQQHEEMAVNHGHEFDEIERSASDHVFQMPVHYPRYSKADYESMPEWK